MTEQIIDEVDRALWELHHRFVRNYEPGSLEDERFLALALAGEAGEVANFVKKQWRGDRVDRAQLRKELDNVFAYWCLPVRCAGFDVGSVVQAALTSAQEKIVQLEAERGNAL